MTNDGFVLKKGLPLGKRGIRYVDGFTMRNLTPDLDIVLWHEKQGVVPSKFVPKDEIWIDWRYKRETDYLLEVMRIETAPEHASLTYAEIREKLRLQLCKNEPAPDFVVRSERKGKLVIKYVRGEIVRRYLDPAFIFGGHDLVYGWYIPKDEVWIDITQDPREARFVLGHELRERARMAKGATYDAAHAEATSLENMQRAERFTVDMEGPLPMNPFRQQAAYCGPASLKIALSYVGKEYAEGRLARICGTTKKSGTLHAGMVRGALKAGATVFEKKNGSLDEIRHFLHTERLPVIVNWMASYDIDKPNPEDDGHYSVAYRMTDKHIYLMDPEIDWGRRVFRLQDFLKERWWDCDRTSTDRVDRWYMVINAEGRTFDIPGGTNHRPPANERRNSRRAPGTQEPAAA